MSTDQQEKSTQVHPLCVLIKELRLAAGMTLLQFQSRSGIPAVVVGAYERGDRIPPLLKLEAILKFYGLKLDAVYNGDRSIRLPKDIASTLRAIADQLEHKHDVVAVGS